MGYTVSDGKALVVACYVETVAVNGNSGWYRLDDGMWLAETHTMPVDSG